MPRGVSKEIRRSGGDREIEEEIRRWRGDKEMKRGRQGNPRPRPSCNQET